MNDAVDPVVAALLWPCLQNSNNLIRNTVDTNPLSQREAARKQFFLGFRAQHTYVRTQLRIFGAIETPDIDLQILNLLNRGIAATDIPRVRMPLVADGRLVKRFRGNPDNLRNIGHQAINVIVGQTDTDTSFAASGLHRRAAARNAHRMHAGIGPEYADDGS